ncbi:uncharacterized protein LOC100829117 [Brachypodium distachyon]|uniref:Uncharacterized protein n=1 Tax=Brachypodium distachyon TaxID=15368 RepID=I1I504_BRADI|nr:uncharacterized protein LOC100829117 [Brachypodium distachyon]PNT67621.1 hypothetical protein BRADI_3g29722v3 [Brachypodium distachyon]|eukprot:XP_003574107.1 uncharacterized protein LOC100829117 [Brachypodium distachyon]
MKLQQVAAVAALVAVALAATTASAVTFEVSNTASSTAGGQRFDQAFGLDYSKQVLSDASTFIWAIFNQPSEADRRPVDTVTLVVEDIGERIAFTIGNGIHLGAQYVGGISGDVKTEVSGVLYHEAVHVWQWGLQDYDVHPWIFEGIADYVRLKADYVPGHWVAAGGGDKWDKGYDVTARFLDYCDSLKAGFVAEMNGKLRDGYSDDYFVQILGKSVEQLWNDYKAKYSQG